MTSRFETGTGANRDVITDFNQAENDIVNLTGMNLNFIGTNAFSGVEGEVRVVAGTPTIIEIDSNGDGTKDAEIELTGNITLTISDFEGVSNHSTFVATSGTDNLTGGAGEDHFFITAEANFNNADTINGAGGNDEIVLTGAGVYTNNFDSSISNVETLRVGSNNGSYTINVTSATGITAINASVLSGNNALTADISSYSNSAVIVTGGSGNDTVTENSQNNTVTLGAGDDVIQSTIANYGASDKFIGGAGADNIIGTAGSDIIDGGAGIDVINAGAGNDVILFDATDMSSSSISGGIGDDTLQIDGSGVNLDLT